MPCGTGWLLAVEAGTALAVYALWLRDPSTFQEHGFVENAQVALLLLAVTVHASRSRKRETVERCLRIGLALFCSSLAVREVDIDRLGDPAIMSTVEAGVRAMLVAAWVVWGWRFRAVFRTVWRNRVPIALGSVGLLVVAGSMLYGASWPFDKYPRLFGHETAILPEQGLQLLATMTLFVASLPAQITVLRIAPRGALEADMALWLASQPPPRAR